MPALFFHIINNYMTRSKKCIFKNLLERDLLYIMKKSKVIEELKNNKIKLSPINSNNGYWYYLYLF